MQDREGAMAWSVTWVCEDLLQLIAAERLSGAMLSRAGVRVTVVMAGAQG